MRLFLVILCFNVARVLSIKCLQCNSLQNANCLRGNLDATDCPTNKNHSYCTTYSGFLKLGKNRRDSEKGRFLLLLRDCSPIDLGNSCRQLLDDPFNKSSERLTFCYTTCQKDGCNKGLLQISSASTYNSSLSTVLSHSYFLLIFLLLLNAGKISNF